MPSRRRFSLRGAVFFDEKKKGLDQILCSLGIDDVEVGMRPSAPSILFIYIVLIGKAAVKRLLAHVNLEFYNLC